MRKKQQSSPIMFRLAIFLAIVFTGLMVAFLVYREGTLPVNSKNTTSKLFTIEPGEPIDKIIRRLESEGFIRNRLAFYFIIKQTGIDKRIQAGKFLLSPSMDAHKLAEELTHGTDDTWITIIEGLRKEEVAEEIKDKLNIPVIEFASEAEEGYMFPDTYSFPSNTTTKDVLAAMKKNYKEKVTPAVIASAKELGLSEKELITMASLVEREARTEESRRMVASILLKRIEEGIPLGVDATIQYAIGYDKDQKTYWKKNITFDDLKINSPYNTYTNQGLPPGPICSPSLSAIIAVSEADPNTPYTYYLTGNDNKMHYSRTLEEHNTNIEKYLR